MKYSYELISRYIKGDIGKKEMIGFFDLLGLNPVVTSEKDSDVLFDLETPANRGYLLSLTGAARELLPFSGGHLNLPSLSVVESISSGMPAGIENTADCSYYSCRLIENIRNGASPADLKKSLEKMGYRSTFNTVDISNFVMAEFGQPIHIFDADRIEGRVEVRRGRPGESAVLIDGKKRDIDENVMVIADSAKIIAVAGIMGCEVSEVKENTRNILIESAVFNPAVVRRGSKKLGLATEASLRFERGIDIDTAVTGMARTTCLVNQICKGSTGKLVEAGCKEFPERKITVDINKASEVLGIEIEEDFISDILEKLNFLVDKENKIYKITPPSYRNDIKEDVDIVEEIARYGRYSDIPSLMPAATIEPTSSIPEVEKTEKIKDIIIRLGFSEFINMGLTSKNNSALNKNSEPVPIENPISANLDFLRSSLVPEILESVKFNVYRDSKRLEVFELGNVCFREKGSVKEELSLVFAAVNRGDFFEFKGKIEKFFEECGFEKLVFAHQPYVFAEKSGNTAILFRGEKIGNIFLLADSIKSLYDIGKEDIYICEVYLEKILDGVNFSRNFKDLPKFPSSRRDFSFVFPGSVSWGEIEDAVFSLDLPIERIDFFDAYRGKNIEEGKISVGFSLLFRRSDKTLENTEVKEFSDKIIEAVNSRLKGKLRSENPKH